MSLSTVPQPSGKGVHQGFPHHSSAAAPAKGTELHHVWGSPPQSGDVGWRAFGDTPSPGISPIARDDQLAFLRKIHGVLSASSAGLQHKEAKCALGYTPLSIHANCMVLKLHNTIPVASSESKTPSALYSPSRSHHTDSQSYKPKTICHLKSLMLAPDFYSISVLLNFTVSNKRAFLISFLLCI